MKRLADMGKDLEVSRSQLVRDALESMVRMYAAKVSSPQTADYSKLNKLSGIINIPQASLSTTVDEIYLIDKLREQHGLS